MSVLSLTLHCHPVWLINPHASHKPPSAEHRLWVRRWTQSLQHNRVTKLNYMSHLSLLGPAWWLWLQCKSLVPVNNLFSNLSKGSPLSLDIRLAERWMGEWGKGQSEVVGAGKPEVIHLPNDLWSQFIMDHNAPQHHTWAVLSPCSGSGWRPLFSLACYLLFYFESHGSLTETYNEDYWDKCNNVKDKTRTIRPVESQCDRQYPPLKKPPVR